MLDKNVDKIYAIDSTAWLPKVDFSTIATLTRAVSQIDQLFDSVDTIFARFIGGIMASMPSKAGFDAATYFDAHFNKDAAKVELKQGIKSGMDKVSRFTGQTGSTILEKGLKDEAKVKYSLGVQDKTTAANKMDWEKLKVNQLYLDLRSRGLTAPQAKEEVAHFADYRKQRAQKSFKAARAGLDKDYKRDMELRVAQQRGATPAAE